MTLLLAAEGKHVKHGAAPHLDPEYCKLIDGVVVTSAAAAGSVKPAAQHAAATASTAGLRTRAFMTGLHRRRTWRQTGRHSMAAMVPSAAGARCEPLHDGRPAPRRCGAFAGRRLHRPMCGMAADTSPVCAAIDRNAGG